MSIMRAALLALCALGSSAPAHATIDNPEKIGIGALSRPGAGPVLDLMGFPFYYTWSTLPSRDVDESSFVPMISHADKVDQPVPAGARTLLGFNEPYRPDQYISPARAIELWPRLMAHNLRLGSPATSPGESTLGPRSWLGEFLSRAEAKNYRVDFVAVHYYSRDGDVEKFRHFLNKVHATYRKPIWVTEWSLHDHARRDHKFSNEQIISFAKRGLEMLDNLPFVERHMWYKTHSRGVGDVQTHILDVNHQLNDVGEVFFRALRRADFGYETIVVPSNLVPNPSFEDPEDLRWQYYWRRNMGQAQVIAGTSRTGVSSLRLGTGAAQVSNDITYRTSPGRSYEMSAWTKLGNAGEKAWIGIKTFDANNKILTNVRKEIVSTAFAEVHVPFAIPMNSERVIVNVYKNPGASYVYVDDVSVVAR